MSMKKKFKNQLKAIKYIYKIYILNNKIYKLKNY